jgi:hypothetical protein
MFFESNLINELDSIETELGANVFELRSSINNNDEKNKRVNKLFQSLQGNNQELSDQQSDQISRIYAVYSWALRIANQPQNIIIGFLNTAFQYAKSLEAKGLFYYVKATVVRGFSDFSESEKIARMALNVFEENSSSAGHTYNCLALALMRQNNLALVEECLNLASARARSRRVNESWTDY